MTAVVKCGDMINCFLLGDLLVKTHLHTWDWVPDDVGVTCSVDSLVMVSPDFYENFYKPYIVRIGETFGGVTVHSCGKLPGVKRDKVDLNS